MQPDARCKGRLAARLYVVNTYETITCCQRQIERVYFHTLAFTVAEKLSMSK